MMLALLVLGITVVVFLFRRTITSLVYGALWAIAVYIGGLFLMPYVVWLFVVGTLGIGSVLCGGHW